MKYKPTSACRPSPEANHHPGVIPVSTTIFEQLSRQAQATPDVIAIHAHGRKGLSYAQLRDHIAATQQSLNQMGAGRGDRVGIVLPGGPELALACLSVSAGAIATPINPDFKQAEYEAVLARLRPKILLTLAGGAHAARAAAEVAGIPVVDVVNRTAAAAGLFTLSGPASTAVVKPGLAQPDDVALVLQTSGTTSVPKTVPLTQANMVASARNLIASLQLTAQDRCLHFLPMFHIGGILDVLIAPLLAGGSTFIAPSFSSAEFYRDLEAYKPTWTQAVPVMLQEILNTADAHTNAAAHHQLRFVRSVSAPLPVPLMEAFEKRFKLPVIEIFGMTETAGVITSNRLPPGKRIPGSVGASAGMEVRIVDAANQPMATDQIGEVVVRGDNLMSGYDADPAENARLYSDAGFRTGDLGYLDADSYLFLTGRVKDMINRGGEKVSPHEVDQALLSHPSVADAVSFPVPHPSLGEDVGAVVVLRAGAATSQRELGTFLRERLAYFKMPRVIQFVNEIPRGANGKIQRAALTMQFGDAAAADAARADYVEPDNPVAKTLAAVWTEILKVEGVGMNDDFFLLGGDSLKAAGLINSLQQKFGDTIYVSSVFDAPTLAQYERYLRQDYPELIGRMLGRFVAPRQAGGAKVTPALVAEMESHIPHALRQRANPVKKNPRAVFVLSTPRTGSTLFRAMLGGHPQLFSPPELYLLAYENLAERRDFFWFNGSHRSQLEGNLRALMQIRNAPANECQALMSELEARGCATHEYYGMLQDWIGDRMLVDKTPAYAMDPEALRRAEEDFEAPFYVHLQRHPYGMIRSFEEARLEQLWYQRLLGSGFARLDRLPFDRRQLAEMMWLVMHRNIFAFLQTIPAERKITLRFEDVTSDPESSMRALCTAMGLEFGAGMLEPQTNKKERMTDGIHEISRMIGDPKFHQHKKIEASVADTWKSAFEVDFLCNEALALALEMGYTETIASARGRTEIEL